MHRLKSNLSENRLVIVGLLLAVAIILQGFSIFQDYVFRYAIIIRDNWSWSSVERSANIAGGVEFGEYMIFLRSQIPEDGKVILPPREPVQAMANFGYMQYFLMPRELHNCGINEVEACILRVTGPTSYIVTAWKFPPPDLAEQVKQFIPFKNDLGVYVPKGLD